ncbi:hypothetical protein [Duganella dendranthematis]|uniref:hypothetical protein n=1 Tax=Duganella dendranthematis TaxID=2728021 RepID=UPI001E5E62E9|nr:hypothetical protein [Duganella dendranthematis]
MNICFTETPSRKTVKPSKTVFLNNTGQDVTLKFVTAPDLVLGRTPSAMASAPPSTTSAWV